ncbi:PTS system cellobiose-specific IIA component [Lactobacillus colini]|uniref:PTS system cellobiose-specific IIA component n=1 Tax=Lactobacillus colini TaxID=1819254 RepID=A0ABS4MGQ1_9LACO|nr:PTS lactose/cellobiose transporter subunit IIA [Lactobacillus colini]MBP2058486.1 PTS system cellobiose-specific IIA component [Lactobacillus colini]
MSEEDSKDVQVSMQIILNAGDARALIEEAFKEANKLNYDKAKDLLEQAGKKLVVAHQFQTDKIQEEAEGKPIKYSVLFTHAQDTLMTIDTEYKLVKLQVETMPDHDKRLVNSVIDTLKKQGKLG